MGETVLGSPQQRDLRSQGLEPGIGLFFVLIQIKRVQSFWNNQFFLSRCVYYLSRIIHFKKVRKIR